MSRNETQRALVPKLRFPEFRGQPLHNICLGDVTAESKTRNADELLASSVMGVRKGEGIVPMEERLVASDIARYKLVQKNWFAYNPMRLNIGSIARYYHDDDVLVSPDYVVFRCLEEGASPGLLPDYLDHFRESNHWDAFVTEAGAGGVRVRIYYRMLAELQLAVPDITEQRRIADCLGSLDHLITAEGRKLEALREHKQGLMQRLFPREGERQPRLRFPEFQHAMDWDSKSLEGVCDLKAGDFVRAAQIGEECGEGMFPCYGGNGLRGYVTTFTHSGRFVLIGRQGALCGNVNLFAGEFHATEHALVANPRSGIQTDWLYYALTNLNLNRFATGQAQPGLSVTVLNSVGIFVPLDEDEQQHIANCLSALDTRIVAQREKLDALRTHKRGLMQQLFPAPEVS
ncbi:MAG: restriction endonuclease subunit S [Lentisphaeria bacterium]|nr:restriction endonuclease subunit S [Lentisphaeria bacterium]